ncbi:MAG: BfmA/BtgA family mobilization protein [Candidatus Pedobacter colombiensis]|uniref:BfmA/BtgA family mobilization protein n=1 Tax=Candidatus Pedobacter colombiensis TaxID=3121371 RepID=A0AAJ5WCX4_9SPHI|nr:BfmA/BtgA family mobilization protein [Pedobacter sp.]WEK20397.1 MAG: BfmA/BtgA family mobilization protein [Pedobacter sp.]
MATRDNYTKSLRFSVETDAKLGKLAIKYGYSKFQFFNQMVEYFHRTKKDPTDINDELLKRTLSRNHDAYTSFIKTQEKVLLIPMHQSVERMIRNQEQIVKYFNEQVLNANKELLKQQQGQNQKTKETDNQLKQIIGHLQSRKKLKEQFLYLFETYVKSRENLGTFKTREREELTTQTRKQIQEL